MVLVISQLLNFLICPHMHYGWINPLWCSLMENAPKQVSMLVNAAKVQRCFNIVQHFCFLLNRLLFFLLSRAVEDHKGNNCQCPSVYLELLIGSFFCLIICKHSLSSWVIFKSFFSHQSTFLLHIYLSILSYV